MIKNNGVSLQYHGLIHYFYCALLPKKNIQVPTSSSGIFAPPAIGFVKTTLCHSTVLMDRRFPESIICFLIFVISSVNVATGCGIVFEHVIIPVLFLTVQDR